MLRRSGVRAPEVCPGRLQGFYGFAPIKRRVSKRVLTITGCFASEGDPRLLQGTLRVFAVSDLHTHHSENLNWVRQLSTSTYQQDVLIVAGDISDDLDDLRTTLSALKERFAVVFFCPGNHELWVAGKQRRHEGGQPHGAAALPAAPATAAASPGAVHGQQPSGLQPARPQLLHPQSPQPRPDPTASPTTAPAGPTAPAAGGPPAAAAAVSSAAPVAAPLPSGTGIRTSASHAPEPTRAAGPAQQPPPFQCDPPAAAHDSLGKLALVMSTCEDLGVVVTPARLGRLRVVPLLAWHHKTFDMEPDIPDIPRASALTISDYARCIWPDRMVDELQQLQPNHNTHPHQPAQNGDPTSGSGCSNGPAATTTTTAVADWRDGGHGSAAVAAWFDALNDSQPSSWRGRGSASGSDGASGSPDSGTGDSNADSTDSPGTGKTRNSRGSTNSSTNTNSTVDGMHKDGSTEVRQSASGEGACCRIADQDPSSSSSSCSSSCSSSSSSSCSSSCSSSSSSSCSSSTSARRSTERESGAGSSAPLSGPRTRSGGGGLAAGVRSGAAAGTALPDDVISFSHFLPLQELLPEKRYLTFPNLAKAVGSTYLGQRVRRLRPQVHVFGHTHFAWDAVHDGIRYLQAPLAYPSERRFRLRSLLMSAAGASPAPSQGPLRAPGAAADRHSAAAGSSPSAPQATTVAAAGANARGTEEEEADDDEEAELDPRLPLPPPLSPRPAAVAAPPEHFRSSEAGRGDPHCHRREQQPQQKDQEQEQPPPLQQQQQHEHQQQQQQHEHHQQQQQQQHEHQQQQQQHEHQQQQQQPAERWPGEGLSAPWPSSTDPRDAGWLPLCIYRAEYTVRLHCWRRSSASGGDGQRPAAARLLLQPSPADADADMGAGSGAVAAGQVPPDGGVVDVEVLEWRSQWCPEQAAMWSGHYKRHPRRPYELQLAPWVAERYSRRMRRNIAKRALGAAPPSVTAAAAVPAPPPLAAAVPADASSYGRAVAAGSSSGPGVRSLAGEGDRGAGTDGVGSGVGAEGKEESGERSAGFELAAVPAVRAGEDGFTSGGSDADVERGLDVTVEETELE